MKFSDIINNDVLVNCETEQEADLLLDYAYKAGLKWSSGDTYKNNLNYEDCGSKTCYFLKKGQYSDIDYWQEYHSDYQMLSFEEVEFDDINIQTEKTIDKIPLQEKTALCVDKILNNIFNQ